MSRIPTLEKKYQVTNRSDVSGNIYYTKNIDFSDRGYMKMSSRMLAIMSDNPADLSGDADFGLVSSFGRYQQSYKYLFGTITNPFLADLSTSAFGVTQDVVSGVPITSVSTRGCFWQNRFYETLDQNLSYKTLSTGAWTTGVCALTYGGGVRHPLWLFTNKNSLCIGDGNTVKLLDTSHAVTITLTLPTNYEVVAGAYSNNKVGIITKKSVDSLHQQDEAYFFVWDGSVNQANQGFPIGTSEAYAIAPYKGTWVILTKTGQLLYFNGGGFQELAVFPFFGKERIWENSDMIGDTMTVDGDKIYINISGRLSSLGIKLESTQQNYSGGLWCYDPEVGLYQTASPTISSASPVTVTSANIDISTNIFTKTAGNLPTSGSPIKYIYNASQEIGGLQAGTVYYVTKIDATHFKLATTRDNAIAGINIDITSTGATNNYFLAMEQKDYGQSLSTFTGGVVLNDARAYTYGKLMMSNLNYRKEGTETAYAQLMVDGFENISAIVTPKLSTGAITDQQQKIYIKYLPLKVTDTITVKAKIRDIIGLPTTTPQNGVTCTWTGMTTLTTTADLSEAMAYLDETHELELEVISGSGGGQFIQIESITENTGTYTVTLSQESIGVASGEICNVIIDNWKVIGTISSADTDGFKEFGVETMPSKWAMFKLILKGTNITIEELQPIPRIQKQAM